VENSSDRRLFKTRQLAKCNRVKANKQTHGSQERTQEKRGWKGVQNEEYTTKIPRDRDRENSTTQPSRKFPHVRSECV